MSPEIGRRVSDHPEPPSPPDPPDRENLDLLLMLELARQHAEDQAGEANGAGGLGAEAEPADPPGDRADSGDAELLGLVHHLEATGMLGPEQLPTEGRVGELVEGYDRYGGLPREKLVDTYWNPEARGGKGGWRYLPDDGFSGAPVDYTPKVDEVLDRFGPPEGGHYLADDGAPYA